MVEPHQLHDRAKDLDAFSVRVFSELHPAGLESLERDCWRHAPCRGRKTWPLPSPLPSRETKAPRLCKEKQPLSMPLQGWAGGSVVPDFGVRTARLSLRRRETEDSLGDWLGQRVRECCPPPPIPPQETAAPAPSSFLHPIRPRALLDWAPREKSLAGDCIPNLPTKLSAGLASQPLALFHWPGRPASAPQPPLPSPSVCACKAPPAPPPANVALGPGPGPDCATRPSSEPWIQ